MQSCVDLFLYKSHRFVCATMTQFSLRIIILFIWLLPTNHGFDFRYHTYSEMTSFLHDMAAQFPLQASLFNIGKSEAGRSLWAIALSAYAPAEHILLRPEVKYIANMHGNEVVGREVLLHLIEYLLTSADVSVQRLMSTSRIWIMPSMNPDGLELAQYGDCDSLQGRYTLNNIDLNRNFPDYLGATLDSSIRASETSAILSWLDAVPFILSANYHGGAFVISTPYDRFYTGQVSTSSDDDIYQTLAQSYMNRIIATNGHCSVENENIGLVTRGADWYEIVGSMQDYGYLNYGTIEMTMEISCCKYPFNDQLVDYWNYNREAMLELLLQAQRGIKGLILNEYYQPIPWTHITIDNRQPVITVTQLGEFWRLLLPGTYTLKVFYRGYEVYRQIIFVSNSLTPLNLTIIIPSFIYQNYTNMPIQILNVFIESISQNSLSSRHRIRTLTIILFSLHIFLFP